MKSDAEFQAWCDARWAVREAERDLAAVGQQAADEARRRGWNDADRLEDRRPSNLRGMDRRLVELARGTASPRLKLGFLLHEMKTRRWFVELGLPSFRAYATQRVSQGTRWANDVRRLVAMLRNEPGLPLVAGALERGELSWSMAMEVANYLRRFSALATSGPVELEAEERKVLDLAQGATVRAVKQGLAERLAGARTGRSSGSDGPDEPDGPTDATQKTEPAQVFDVYASDYDEDAELRRFERTVPMHEAWIVECARVFFDALVHHKASDTMFIDGLIGEAYSSMGMPTEAAGERFRVLYEDAAVARVELERQRQKRAAVFDEREAAAEGRMETPEDVAPRAANQAPVLTPIAWPELPTTARELDAEIRRLCAELEKAEVDLCTSLVAFDERSGWRICGFASRNHYARERLGLSRQSANELRARGRLFREFPALLTAVQFGSLGVSAARLIAKVATPDTVHAWIERASQRTVVHLREEVEAVRISVRCGVDCDLMPPSEEMLARTATFEREVLSGKIPTPLHEQVPEEVSVGMSVRSGDELTVEDSPGVTYRFWLPFEVALEFELAERVYREMVPDTPEKPRPSLLIYACLMLYAAHIDEVEHAARSDRWRNIYERDRFRCQNPVCGARHTVTPHHMKFQSQGGGDEEENMKTLCDVCHLDMVHARKSLVVEPPASNTRWLIGGRSSPLLEVVGREVVGRAS